MGIFGNLILGMVHLASFLLDLAEVFTLVRILAISRPVPLIQAMDTATGPFVRLLLRRTRLDRLTVVGNHVLPERGRLWLLLALLCLAGFVLSITSQLIR